MTLPFIGLLPKHLSETQRESANDEATRREPRRISVRIDDVEALVEKISRLDTDHPIAFRQPLPDFCVEDPEIITATHFSFPRPSREQAAWWNQIPVAAWILMVAKARIL
jgi:hypothetical protein